MYKYNEIKVLHLELSSNCQAKCPMCARNFHGGMENPLLKVSDITLELFTASVPPEFLAQLERLTMCGNFGDPLLNNDLIPIIEYIRDSAPNIKLDVHTNGSLRSKAWWTALAKAMPQNHLVQFGIDGLEDTHALYRIGTDFNKIIENAKTYIAAGGLARWNFITFKHNEHQLETARQMAKDLGFDSFYEKQTSRFIGNPWFDVYDKDGNVTHKLESPSERKLIFIDRKTVENYREIIKTATVVCEVEKNQSVYIDALGYVHPCCFIAGVPYTHAIPEQLVYDYRNDAQASLNKVFDKFGGMEFFNLRNNSIKDIVDSHAWQTIWDQEFKDNTLETCARTCGKFPEPVVSQCRDQFLDLDEFNE
jgi:MoaA/NifB/PqqE/SkfB family radical SAM enzyme